MCLQDWATYSARMLLRIATFAYPGCCTFASFAKVYDEVKTVFASAFFQISITRFGHQLL